MKIALFTDSFPPSFGGAENAVARFSAALSKSHEVIVFAPDNNKPYNDSVYPFKVVRVKSLQVSPNDYYAMPFIDRKVKRTLDAFSPDVMHFQTVGQMAAFCTRYAKKHGIPTVSTVHTKYYYCYKHAFKSTIVSKLLLRCVMNRVKRATAVCAVSESMKQTLKSYGVNNPISVIRNGGEKKPALPEKIRLSYKFTLLYVGLVISYKNIGFSLQALAELKKKRDDFIFYIVGHGPHIKKFSKLAKKLGLGENVIFVGGVAGKEELNRYYSGADLMLFPSIFDTDGLVILEGANNRLPTLTIRGTGASERLTDNVTGFTEENSPKAFAQRIESLMENKALLNTVGENAADIFTDWETTANNYAKIYQEILGLKKDS